MRSSFFSPQASMSLADALQALLQPEIHAVLASGWLKDTRASSPLPALRVRNKAIKRLIRGLRHQTSVTREKRQRQVDVLRHLQRTRPLAHETPGLRVYVHPHELTWVGNESYGRADVRGSYVEAYSFAAESIRLEAGKYDDTCITVARREFEDARVFRCEAPSDAFRENECWMTRIRDMPALARDLAAWAATHKRALPDDLELPALLDADTP
jgi:hypothetical protein